MSEFSSSSTTFKKTDHLSSLLLSDLFLFCSFIISHPLYFSYLIFFSPYLLKLLSFLSPLFITTSLLLLALLTFSPNLVNDCPHTDQLSGSKVISTFLYLKTYQAFVERLRSKVESDGAEEFHHFEELEAYKIVFDVEENHPAEVSDQLVEAQDCFSSADHELLVDHNGELSRRHIQVVGAAGGGVPDDQVINGNLDGNSESVRRSGSSTDQELIAEGKTLGGFFMHQKEEFEDLWFQKEEKEAVKPINVKYSNKVIEEGKEEASMIRSGSKAISQKTNKANNKESGGGDDDEGGGEHYYSPKLSSKGLEAANSWSPGNGGDCSPKVKDKSETLMGYSNLGSFGSMRKEKEWRRTLACKLFEERHNVDGGEGMDMLWETYETDSIKVQSKSKTKKGKKGSIGQYCYDIDEEEVEEEENDGQLCCLQALKFSAGKMNLGMGRPNLVKISKALKGIGWLHHVTRHSKKGHH